MRTFPNNLVPLGECRTRDGRKAVVLSNTVHDGAYPVVAVITQPNGSEFSVTATASGSILHGGCFICEADLQPNPVIEQRFLNIYDSNCIQHTAFRSRNLANKQAEVAHTPRQAVITLTFEDGVLVSDTTEKTR